MSWFDTAGFVSVAKSALKEAQKTIDKALDIKEDGDVTKISIPPSSTEKDESDGFFSAWGVKGGGSPEKSTFFHGPPDSSSSSLWGSFSGSFFETQKSGASTAEEVLSSPISKQPKRSASSRISGCEGDADVDSELALGDDRTVWEGFAKTQLVVESPVITKDDKAGSSLPANPLNEEVKWRRKERQNDRSQNRNSYPNRLSVISSESDKRSSDSVEVLGSTSCTASPDSDMPTSLSASSLASSAGLRAVSASSPDSVEVIPESSDSHSVSVEVLGSCSNSTSLSSPLEPDRLTSFGSKDLASPDSVEVVPDEEEDGSLADDSYASASASESTVTQATVLEPHGQPSSAMDSSTCFLEPIDSSGPGDGITSSTSGRTDSSVSSLLLDSSTDTIHSDHGSVGRVCLQPTVTSDYAQQSKTPWPSAAARSQNTSLENIPNKLLGSPKKCMPKSRESPTRSLEKKDWKPGESRLQVTDSSSEDNLTVAAVSLTDSSGEGTLVESSSDDTIPPNDFPPQQSSSGYVKNLLADAMMDDISQMRVNSPVSLESRSEVGQRIGSEQTSGHTSGDELETTTSSDIEIISSPNGDGSSTASRHSPAKLVHRGPHSHVDKFPGKIKGHQREPSEASSGGSDDSHGSEMDRLVKRLSEVSEHLEARETKLLALSRSHAELQERHQELHSQLESAQQSRLSESRSLNEASEEFTRRLSALERKFQQAIREKDTLQKQLELLKSERALELSERVGERDETIRELRIEGEKLSRQLLQQSNLIKKLRSKEKESDNSIKSLGDQVESLTGEIERLKRSLAAKEDVERSQIEAVHQLTAKLKKMEAELTAVKEQKDELQRKAEGTQTALDNSMKELRAARAREQGADQRVREATQTAEDAARAELEAALQVAQEHKRHIVAQVDRLREQLAQAEAQHTRRESELLERMEAAERRGEGLGQQLSEATRPLLRQLQALQASCKTQQDAWERQERTLSEALGDAQAQLGLASEAERAAREELVSLRSKASSLESKLAVVTQTAATYQERTLHLGAEVEKLKILFDGSKQAYENQLDELKRQVSSLDHQWSVEKAATDAEKRRNSQLQEQLNDRIAERNRERETEGGKRESPLAAASGHSSPTISFGRDSISESVSSMAWPVFADDAFETMSTSGRNVYESVRSSHTTSLLEGLQSQLKLREGEVQQLQWELSRRESQRCALTAELSSLSARAEDQEGRLTASVQAQEALTAQLATLRTEYDALLQLYGEKLEESQELRLDLQDVKDMYKAQIDQLLKKEEQVHRRARHDGPDDQQNTG